MSLLARILLLIIILLGPLHAETQYAKPLQDFQVGYPIEPFTLKLYKGSQVTLQRKANNYLFITKDEDPTVLKVNRYGPSRKPLFIQSGAHLETLELIHAPVDQGWALFSTHTAYPIIEQGAKEITLELPKTGDPLRTKLPVDYFKIYTKQELDQEIAKLETEAENARIAAEIARKNRPLVTTQPYQQPKPAQKTTQRQLASPSTAKMQSIDYFADKEKAQFQISGDTAYCLAVCDGNRDTRTLQLVLSYRRYQGSIRVDCYLDGVRCYEYVYVEANGQLIHATGAMSLKNLTDMAKAVRREIHLGQRGQWIDSYQMIGDRPLHQFIKFVEEH